MKIPTLMYHDILGSNSGYESGFDIPGASRYKYSLNEFKEHLNSIKATSLKPVLINDIIESQSVSKCFMITFDDGGISFSEFIAPLLNELNWKGHFFITTDYIGKKGFMNKEQVRELRKMGHVIGSHSCSHPAKMSSLPVPEIKDEWHRSREILSDIIGESVDTASVPGGFYSKSVGVEALNEKYKYLFTSEPERKIKFSNGIWIAGRYTMFNYLNATKAAALVSGRQPDCVREYLYWNIKKAGKKYAGGIYKRIREKTTK